MHSSTAVKRRHQRAEAGLEQVVLRAAERAVLLGDGADEGLRIGDGGHAQQRGQVVRVVGAGHDVVLVCEPQPDGAGVGVERDRRGGRARAAPG